MALPKPILTEEEPPTTLANGMYIDPSKAQSDPKAVQAEITKAQYDYARQTFLPAEDRVIEEITSPDRLEADADRAGSISRATFMKARETFGRDLSRKGFGLSAAQNDALERRRAIRETKGIATAENVTRRTLQDRNRNLLGSMAGLGKGIASSSMDAFSGAADAQASREATTKAMEAQSKASKTGGAASGAAMGAAYGPWGAVAGGVIGWLAG